MRQWSDLASRVMERAKNEPLKILVWGPGDPGPTAPPNERRAYEKRLEIKEVLKREFPNAEVCFSEDPAMREIAQEVRGQLLKEALQAKTSDLILVLGISRGADVELDHFIPTYPWFRDKVHVFLPEQYVPPRGLVSEVFGYLRPDRVEGFTQDEFEECKVATEKAVEVAAEFALGSILSS